MLILARHRPHPVRCSTPPCGGLSSGRRGSARAAPEQAKLFPVDELPPPVVQLEQLLPSRQYRPPLGVRAIRCGTPC
jgi:hypothetical protein